MSKWTEEYRKEYDQKRNARNKVNRTAQKQSRLVELRKWFNELKSSLKCSQCPENHPACLQFHHRSDKDREISNMIGGGFSKERILAEIAKCDVLCANCHSKHHWAERQP